MAKERLKHIIIFLYISFILIFINLIRIQILYHSYWNHLANKQSHLLSKESGIRGEIKTSDGLVLAYNLFCYNIEINSNLVKDNKLFINFLLKFLNFDKEKVLGLLNAKKYFELNIQIDEKKKEEIEKNEDFKKFGKALYFRIVTKRLYNSDEYRHIVGFTQDNKGAHGIEKMLEEELGGTSRIIKRQVSATELYEVNVDLSKAVIDGANVVLTIDSILQHILTEELEKGLMENQALSATGIILNPKNGKILALSSLPFLPNKFLRNRAISDIYEPGSVIKPLIVGIALESNSIDESYSCYTNGSTVLYGNIIKDEPGCKRGTLTLEEAIGYSTNVGMVNIVENVDSELLYKYLKNFGFGSKTNISLYGESKGIFSDFKKWNAVTKSYMSFGYNIACTPIQVVMAFASLVNGGNLYKPQIIERIEYKNGKNKNVENELVKKVVSKETSDFIKKALTLSYEKGTASVYAKVKGYSIGCKTGTTKKIKEGLYSKTYIATFTAVYPAEDPEYLIFIKVDEPGGKNIYGSNVAAPIFRKVFKKLVKYKNILPNYERAIELD